MTIMKTDRDIIYIVTGIILAAAWAMTWHRIPDEYRIFYLFILPIIVMWLWYIIVINRYVTGTWLKSALWLVIIFMGLVSFSHAIFKFDVFKAISQYMK